MSPWLNSDYNLPMNIVLIGYRGSGKTTIGKLLAEELWKPFVDTDALIVHRFGGMTIREIWETHGEEEFRAMECRVVEEVMKQTDQVIALGGGTLMQPAARAAVEAAKGTMRIYLQCDPQTLLDRIAADTATAGSRPNLTTLGGSLDEIVEVLEEREPVYRAVADKVFDVTHVTPQDAVMHIVRRCL